MKFRALATDYDGTIAWHGAVPDSTCEALERFKASGRKLLLVTGRELHDLFSVFQYAKLFDLMVMENGGLLYNPQTQESEVLAPPVPKSFVDRLRAEGVRPLSVGHAIVGTQQIYQGLIEEIIREMEFDLQIILNKGALMVLPAAVDKASGLNAALDRLGITRREVVGVGDAENDFAFLRLCGRSVAVNNALPALKEQVNGVTRGSRGAGVEELVEGILAEDRRLEAREMGLDV
jgi:HAD superfamily hydrolase (TIGR01484 family)